MISRLLGWSRSGGRNPFLPQIRRGGSENPQGLRLGGRRCKRFEQTNPDDVIPDLIGNPVLDYPGVGPFSESRCRQDKNEIFPLLFIYWPPIFIPQSKFEGIEDFAN